VKDLSPGKAFFSLATQMRMRLLRYQAVDHDGVTMLGRSDTVLFSNYKHFRREY
jgi:hypothetical protein